VRRKLDQSYYKLKLTGSSIRLSSTNILRLRCNRFNSLEYSKNSLSSIIRDN